MITDNAFLLAVLNDGKWHSNTEILQASIAERGCGLTVHSRASDFRKRGYIVETKHGINDSRRLCYYRLGALNSSSEVAAELSASSIPAGRSENPSERGGDALFTLPKGAYDE